SRVLCGFRRHGSDGQAARQRGAALQEFTSSRFPSHRSLLDEPTEGMRYGAEVYAFPESVLAPSWSEFGLIRLLEAAALYNSACSRPRASGSGSGRTRTWNPTPR